MKRLASAAVIATASLIGIPILTQRDPANAPPKPIAINIGQSIVEFARRNDISFGSREAHGFAIDVDVQDDVTPVIYDDNWLAVTYEDTHLGFELPAGRTLIVDQDAGRIRAFTANLFAHALPLDQTNEQLKPLFDRLAAAGWVARTPTTFPLAREQLNERTGSRIIAQMKPSNAAYPRLEITVSDLEQVPRSESWIVSSGRTPDAGEQGGYVVQVRVAERAPGYDQFVYPRRLFETGDKGRALPLRVWIDDPDWTPQGAGMVPASQKQLSVPDFSSWVMPSNNR